MGYFSRVSTGCDWLAEQVLSWDKMTPIRQKQGLHLSICDSCSAALDALKSSILVDGHLTDDQIQSLQEEIPSELFILIVAHLQGCAECRRRFDQLLEGWYPGFIAHMRFMEQDPRTAEEILRDVAQGKFPEHLQHLHDRAELTQDVPNDESLKPQDLTNTAQPPDEPNL